MGFDFGKAIGGALTGFVGSGFNPAGAVAGGLAGGLAGGGKQQQTSRATIDPALLPLRNQVLGQALSFGNQPINTFQGQRVAGFNPTQLGAFNLMNNAALSGMGTLQQGIGALGNISRPMDVGFNAIDPSMSGINRGSVRDVSGGTVSEDAIRQYMNPFLAEVMDRTTADIERQRQIQGTNDAARAVSARAFGGSRQGVANALTNEAFARTLADQSANLRFQGFNTALGAAQQDLSRGLQANLANQQYDFNTANQNAQMGMDAQRLNQAAALQAAMANQSAFLQGNNQFLNQASLFGQLGGQLSGMTRQQAMDMLQAGMLQQGQSQAEIDAAMRAFYEPRNMAMENMNFLQGIVNGVPANRTQTSTDTSTPNTLSQLFQTGLLGKAAGEAFPDFGNSLNEMFGGKLGSKPLPQN